MPARPPPPPIPCMLKPPPKPPAPAPPPYPDASFMGSCTCLICRGQTAQQAVGLGLGWIRRVWVMHMQSHCRCPALGSARSGRLAGKGWAALCRNTFIREGKAPPPTAPPHRAPNTTRSLYTPVPSCTTRGVHCVFPAAYGYRSDNRREPGGDAKCSSRDVE